MRVMRHGVEAGLEVLPQLSGVRCFSDSGNRVWKRIGDVLKATGRAG